MYKYFPQNFVPCCSQSIFCPVDITDHVSHWSFTDRIMLATTKNAKRGKKYQQQQKQKTPFKIIFWEI
jgi:hypothetical protein